MRIKVIFKWYDFWVGFFWDQKKKYLYFFPVPMLGIVFKFRSAYKEFLELAKKQVNGKDS